MMNTTTRHTRAVFDDSAEGYHERNYERPTSRHEENLWQRREVVWRLMRDLTGRCLDIGCGPGSVCIPLASSRLQVTAIDLSTNMVKNARRVAEREGTAESVNLAAAEATRLPFKSESFDIAVSTGVIEYIPEPARAMAEIGRILTPGGVALLTASLPQRIERLARRGRSMLKRTRGPAPAHHQAFTATEFDALVASSGFEITERAAVYLVPFPLDVAAPGLARWLFEHAGQTMEASMASRYVARTYVVRGRKLANA